MARRYVSEREISNLTGISVQTLRNWRHLRRGFPYIKVAPRFIRYDINQVEAFMEARKINPEVRHSGEKRGDGSVPTSIGVGALSPKSVSDRR